MRVWLAISLLIVGFSLFTGYRASSMAGVPQYLFTKTRVIVDVPYVPADAGEAAEEAAFREAGNPASTVAEFRPMFVLGLLDGALPAILVCGVGCLVWSRRRRGRVQNSSSGARGP